MFPILVIHCDLPTKFWTNSIKSVFHPNLPDYVYVLVRTLGPLELDFIHRFTKKNWNLPTSSKTKQNQTPLPIIPNETICELNFLSDSTKRAQLSNRLEKLHTTQTVAYRRAQVWRLSARKNNDWVLFFKYCWSCALTYTFENGYICFDGIHWSNL